MNKDEYIHTVLKHISNQSFINTIKQELEGHIDDRIFYYEEIGYDTDASTEKAICQMGDADKLGKEMNLLHDYKKHKIISISGLILFAVNTLISYCSLTVLNYLPLDSSYIAIYIYSSFSLILSFIIYRYAFEAREKTVLFLHGLMALFAGIFLIKVYGFAIVDMSIPSFIYTSAAKLILFIHSLICITCSAEVGALIKGRANSIMLKRYKNYEYFLLFVTIAALITSTILTAGIVRDFL